MCMKSGFHARTGNCNSIRAAVLSPVYGPGIYVCSSSSRQVKVCQKKIFFLFFFLRRRRTCTQTKHEPKNTLFHKRLLFDWTFDCGLTNDGFYLTFILGAAAYSRHIHVVYERLYTWWWNLENKKILADDLPVSAMKSYIKWKMGEGMKSVDVVATAAKRRMIQHESILSAFVSNNQEPETAQEETVEPPIHAKKKLYPDVGSVLCAQHAPWMP